MLIQGNHVLAEQRKRTKQACLAPWRWWLNRGGNRFSAPPISCEERL
jgi:hypothetical protein